MSDTISSQPEDPGQPDAHKERRPLSVVLIALAVVVVLVVGTVVVRNMIVQPRSPDVAWTAYSGIGAYATAVAVADDGSVFVVGSVYSGSTFSPHEATVTKLSAAGETVWRLNVPSTNGPGEFQISGVAIAPNGNIILVGQWEPWESARPSQKPQRAVIYCLSPEGTLIWHQTIGQGNGRFDSFYKVATFADDSIVVVGHVTVYNSDNDMSGGSTGQNVIAKFTPEGTLTWWKTSSDLGLDAAFTDVAVGPDGRILVCGDKEDPPGGSVVASLTTDGETIWTEHTDQFGLTAIAVAPDGSIVVGIVASSWNNPGFVAKYTHDGDMVWSTNNTTWPKDWGLMRDVSITQDGHVIAVGASCPDGQKYAAVVSFDPDGAISWTKTIGGIRPMSSELRNVAVAQDGRVVATGAICITHGYCADVVTIEAG